MTDIPAPHEQLPDDMPPETGRFLGGIGQWGGWFINYTDRRVRIIERLEANGLVTIDRTGSAYMVVTLTEQGAIHAPSLSAQASLHQLNEQLTAQLEAALNATPRTVYPAMQAAVQDLEKALTYVDEGGDADLVSAAASHLLKALYDTKLISKPGESAGPL